MSGLERSLDLIDAIIYADLFDCAVTPEELWRFSRVRCALDEITTKLSGPQWQRIVVLRNGYYCLHGREELAERRPGRQARARHLFGRAKRVVSWLQYTPFVRGALLTGSVAADDAEPDADIDLLLIIAQKRIALVFLLMGSISRVTSRKIFCPNYYLSADHLQIDRHSHYVAREIAQSMSLAHVGSRLIDANPWVRETLPNTTTRTSPLGSLPGLGLLQKLIEAPLLGRLGDRLEARARAIALKRLEHHHGLAGRPVPEKVAAKLRDGIELRFHESQRLDEVNQRYATLRREIGRKLEAGGVSIGDG
jgi:predicted nucleotidyltransferase